MNPCASRGKQHPRAYIGAAGRPKWPYSVAWISQRLAEPRTRVRIAVGPPFNTNQLKQESCFLFGRPKMKSEWRHWNQWVHRKRSKSQMGRNLRLQFVK